MMQLYVNTKPISKNPYPPAEIMPEVYRENTVFVMHCVTATNVFLVESTKYKGADTEQEDVYMLDPNMFKMAFKEKVIH
jgi:hypothetical protein